MSNIVVELEDEACRPWSIRAKYFKRVTTAFWDLDVLLVPAPCHVLTQSHTGAECTREMTVDTTVCHPRWSAQSTAHFLMGARASTAVVPFSKTSTGRSSSLRTLACGGTASTQATRSNTTEEQLTKSAWQNGPWTESGHGESGSQTLDMAQSAGIEGCSGDWPTRGLNGTCSRDIGGDVPLRNWLPCVVQATKQTASHRHNLNVLHDVRISLQRSCQVCPRCDGDNRRG
mmetsp:Transcript_63273/g.205368  ORF Transcript_63273/g.205368 Transcript_63273/m.205368 type:complete len:230 (+) Transcript_63273:355-1044(+)